MWLSCGQSVCLLTGAPMDNEFILNRFDDLSIWKQGEQRAPHKPLLVLYALGRSQRGDTGDLPIDQLAPDVAALPKEFGPPRRPYYPEYPFWWLQREGVWTIESDGPMAPRASSNNPTKAKRACTAGANTRG
jgi:putative restriction endonuclease